MKHGKPDHEATNVRNIVQGIKLVNEFCYLHIGYLSSLGWYKWSFYSGIKAILEAFFIEYQEMLVRFAFIMCVSCYNKTLQISVTLIPFFF